MHAWFRTPQAEVPTYPKLICAWLFDQFSSENADKAKLTLEERKQIWLRLTMLIDKLVFAFMLIINILSPIFLFYIVPSLQN